MNWQGFGKKRLWHNRTAIPVFAWKDRQKQRKFTFRLVSQIRTEHLPDTKSITARPAFLVWQYLLVIKSSGM
jgi:hypothetical protein